MLRKHEIQSVINGIEKVKLNKLEDKSMSTVLFKDYMLLCGKLRQYRAEQEDLHNLFLKEHREEQEVVEKLQNDFNLEKDNEKRAKLANEISSHEEYLNAVKAFNEKMAALGNEVVKVELIDGEKFGEAYQKTSEWDITVIGQLYPLFKEDDTKPEE